MMFTTLLVAMLSQGAYTDPPITEKDLTHWAFREVERPAPPGTSGHPIDRFIDHRLALESVRAHGATDRRTLIRRVTFDLCGVPPTPEEVESFVRDESADAYSKVVARLLGSAGYGERWAQHWLDLIRFAETEGFQQDYTRVGAWRYRDWVIKAFNSDMPYDRFLQLQIAGDEIAPDDPEAKIATGFIMSGPDMSDINTMEERRHVLHNDITSMVGQSLMGLTFRCAECHDHKYDPLSTGDFYRLRAIFNNVGWAKKKKTLPAVVDEFNPEAPLSFVMIRGNYVSPGVAAPPSFPRVLNPAGISFNPRPSKKTSGRRRAFAEWLTRKDHPLVGRVLVNWLWGHHFGRGIVTTPGDFGIKGSPPSHPQLLDWLASEFVQKGWSLKAMHRLMVTSAAYCRSGRGPEVVQDPTNALFWKMNRRRLEGEAIRDTMLIISDRLNGKRYGPGVKLLLPKSIIVTFNKKKWNPTKDPNEYRRRSIYLFSKRNLRVPLFDVFDRPVAESSCAARIRSTTPIQSLMLLNSQFSWDTARGLADRVRKKVTLLTSGPSGSIGTAARTCS